MSFPCAAIELVSSPDLSLFQAGYLTENQIKRLRVNALVDTHVAMMLIPESIKNQLGLHKIDEQWVELADGSWILAELSEPIQVRFENRTTIATPFVIPNQTNVVIGKSLMLAMDVLIDLKQERLIVNPKSPDRARMLLK